MKGITKLLTSYALGSSGKEQVKKRKYRMVKWEVLIRPKDFGGLGILDVRAMNVCLVAKWLDRLENDVDNMCCDLLRRKYLGQKNIFQIKRSSGSQFWRGVLGVRKWFQWERAMKIKSGRQTRFWEDVWLGDRALKIDFHNLYNCCSDQSVTMEEALRSAGCNLKFRRSLTHQEMREWELMMDALEAVQLNEGRDETLWLLENKKRYTIKSLYRMMIFGGVRDPMMIEIWKCKVPLKIQIFLWMVFYDRIQSAFQLRKRKWGGPIECKMCGVIETTE